MSPRAGAGSRGKLRVLVITPHISFEGRPGVGMPVVHRTLAAWASAGHELEALVLGEPEPREWEGIRITGFQVPGRKWGSDWGGRLDGLPVLEYLAPLGCRLRWLAAYTRSAVRAGLALAKRSPGPWDLVYGHTWWSGPAAASLAHRLGAESLLRVYGAEELGGREAEAWLPLKFLDRRIALRGPRRLIITDDTSFSPCLASRLGLPEERIVRWVNGVDRTAGRGPEARSRARRRWGLPDTDAGCGPVILSLSRLSPIKRVELVLETAARLPGSRVLLAGEGQQEGALRELSRRLGIADRVSWTGMLDREGVRDAIAAADLLVSAYRTANLSNQTWEAMEAGLPVLVLDHGDGARFIDDGRTGCLVIEPGDPGEIPELLAARIRELRSRPGALEAMGRAAREWAQRELPTWQERISREIELAHALRRPRPSLPSHHYKEVA